MVPCPPNDLRPIPVQGLSQLCPSVRLQPWLGRAFGEIHQKAAGGLGPGFSELTHQLDDTSIGERVIADHQELLELLG